MEGKEAQKKTAKVFLFSIEGQGYVRQIHGKILNRRGFLIETIEILESCMVLPIYFKNSPSREAFVNGINYTIKVLVRVLQ